MTPFKRLGAGFAVILSLCLMGAPAVAQDGADAMNRLAGIVEAWRASPHADFESGAFTHWNDEEAREIPGSCAVCHSGIAYNDYVMGPMETPGRIDHPVPLGSTVDCAACHGATPWTNLSVHARIVQTLFSTGAQDRIAKQSQRYWKILVASM